MSIIDVDINTNTKLFKLIKNHEYDKLKEILNDKTIEIDLNIRDKSNNYLIQYAILFNKPEILTILLNNEAKTDILDIDGRGLLFNPIKYNYTKILEILLKNDKHSIGISLLEFSDNNGYYPIHYCILFKNMECLKLILNNFQNFSINDKVDNTPLHLAIKTKSLDIFNLILKNKSNINKQNKDGETPLHIACNFNQFEMAKILLENNADANITDYNNNITPLMYSVIINDFNLFNLLVSVSDIDIQDFLGNNILHYTLNENNIDMANRLFIKYEHLNTPNLQGKLPLHIILENTINNIDSFNKMDIKTIINKTNLNIQDNYGNSCFYLMVKKKIWNKLFDTLKLKKINAYLTNNNNIRIMDLIEEESMGKFVDLLSESYLSQLRNNETKVWLNEIDKLCEKNLSGKKYLSIKKELNLELDDLDIRDWDKNVCKRIISKLIIKNKKSFPIKKKKYCINIAPQKNVSFVTYTGIPLDVMFGIIYLKKQYNEIDTILTTEFQKNMELQNYYTEVENKTISIDNFINFEIIWNHQKIFYPTILDEIIYKFKNNNNKFLILPIGIELSSGSHANVLIYDKNTNEMERFEPNGSTYPYKYNYNPELLDNILLNKFREYFPDMKYFKPIDYIPKIGFQALEAFERHKKKIGDPGGFCASWSTWYANMRIKYSDMDRAKLILKLIQKIKENNIKFKDLIRNYSKKITNLRDEYLTESDLDVNDWINGNYDKDKVEKLILILQQLIREIS